MRTEPANGSATGRGRVVTNGLVVAAAFAVALTASLFTEKIADNNGLGWDGRLYGALAREYRSWKGQPLLPDIAVRRMLPSVVVHHALKVVGRPSTDENIIHFFAALNIVLITLAAFLWCRVADCLHLSPRGKWLGFLAFFVNFAVLKWPAYYPVLTDVSALTLGMLSLYCYLAGRSLLLLAATVAGAFVWPTQMVVGLLLLLFPRRTDGVEPVPAPRLLPHAAGMAAALAGLACSIVVIRSGFRPVVITAAPVQAVLPLSVLVVMAYLYLVVRGLCDDAELFSPRRLLSGLYSWRLPVVLAVFVAVGWWQTRLSLPSTQGRLTLRDYLNYCFYSGVARPGGFFVAHVVYYGPIILLAALLWRRTCVLVHTQGVGLILALTAGVCFGVDGESRHVVNFFPLLVPFVVQAAEALRWGRLQMVLFAGLSLAYSKMWLTMATKFDPELLIEFPAQTLFMNLGPWMCHSMYVAQGAAVLLTGWWLYRACRIPTAVRVEQPLARAA